MSVARYWESGLQSAGLVLRKVSQKQFFLTCSVSIAISINNLTLSATVINIALKICHLLCWISVECVIQIAWVFAFKKQLGLLAVLMSVCEWGRLSRDVIVTKIRRFMDEFSILSSAPLIFPYRCFCYFVYYVSFLSLLVSPTARPLTTTSVALSPPVAVNISSPISALVFWVYFYDAKM